MVQEIRSKNGGTVPRRRSYSCDAARICPQGSSDAARIRPVVVWIFQVRGSGLPTLSHAPNCRRSIVSATTLESVSRPGAAPASCTGRTARQWVAATALDVSTNANALQPSVLHVTPFLPPPGCCWWILSQIGCGGFTLAAFMHMNLRREIRRHYGLPEECCNDCCCYECCNDCCPDSCATFCTNDCCATCCCPSCALCQEARHLKLVAAIEPV